MLDDETCQNQKSYIVIEVLPGEEEVKPVV